MTNEDYICNIELWDLDIHVHDSMTYCSGILEGPLNFWHIPSLWKLSISSDFAAVKFLVEVLR